MPNEQNPWGNYPDNINQNGAYNNSSGYWNNALNQAQQAYAQNMYRTMCVPGSLVIFRSTSVSAPEIAPELTKIKRIRWRQKWYNVHCRCGGHDYDN